MKHLLIKHIICSLLMLIPFLGIRSQNTGLINKVEIPVQFSPKAKGAAQINLDKKIQITGMAFSPNDRLLATGGYQEICLWNLKSPSLKQRFISPLIKGHVRDIQFIDQHTLVIGCGEAGISGQVHIIDLRKNTISLSFFPSKDVICKIAVSPLKDIISAADANGNIFIFNTTKKTLLCKPEKLNSEITGLAFSKDTFKISYCSVEGQMMVWDYKNQTRYHLSSYEKQLMGFQYIKNNKNAVVAINNNQNRIIQAISINNNTGDIKKIKKNNAKNKTINLAAKKPTSLVSYNKGSYYAVGCSDGSVLFYSTGNSVKEFKTQEHKDWISSLQLSNNEAMMASADAEGLIKIWSFTNKKPILSLIQIANGRDEWVAISSRGYYNASSAELVQWKDEDSIPPYMQNKLYNPAKLNELVNISELKAPRANYKSKR